MNRLVAFFGFLVILVPLTAIAGTLNIVSSVFKLVVSILDLITAAVCDLGTSVSLELHTLAPPLESKSEDSVAPTQEP